MSRPIPEALLERYLAGDLDPAERAALEARFTEEDRKRVEALRADSAAFLIKHPPGPVVAKLEAQPKRRWGVAWLLAPLAAGAASIALFVLRPPAPEPDVGIKGELAVAVYRQTAGGSERVEADAALRPGDRVRFEVRAPQDGFIAVLSRDGAGHVTAYYPYQGTDAAKYRVAEPVLPGAISLDDTPGTEDAWALYAREPFALAPLIQQLEKGAQPSAKGVATARVSWKKSVP